MDKMLILWKPDPLSGVWMEEVNIRLVCPCVLACTYLCVPFELQQLRMRTACVIKLVQIKSNGCPVEMPSSLSQAQLTVISLHFHKYTGVLTCKIVLAL